MNTIDMTYDRVQSAGKIIRTRADGLTTIAHKTLKTVAEIVGATLGPGGRSVVIQAKDPGRAPIVTKDGVTVFRALGFEDTVQQVLMEAVRDSAVRTAQEAGDGTTTATILANSVHQATEAFCTDSRRYSPQKVVRELESVFRSEIEPAIRRLATRVSIGTEEGRKKLLSVAAVSANGDQPLAGAVLECFDVVGDDGNVTLLEIEGESHYEVEQIQGYPIAEGFEKSTGRFYQGFINDQAKQMCVLEKPLYLLYYGTVSSIDPFRKLLSQVIEYFPETGTRNVVIVAPKFGERAIVELHATFPREDTLKVFPMALPLSPMKEGQYDTLLDLAAVTGGKVMDPINFTPEEANINHLGRTESFEAGRFRSNVLGFRDEILIDERASALRAQISNPDTAQLDRQLIQERLGKLTSGIAKLKIYGTSNGELREKRDRAEDAVCAVRGALKHGILPGGGYTLVQLWKHYSQKDIAEHMAATQVLANSLLAPVQRLYENLGFTPEEFDEYVQKMVSTDQVFDLLNMRWVDKIEGGVIDSAPAVIEAIRNSLSIAALLGTCGGVIVFGRDRGLERDESQKEADWRRQLETVEADQDYSREP
jgi:chaperonin GroEL